MPLPLPLPLPEGLREDMAAAYEAAGTLIALLEDSGIDGVCSDDTNPEQLHKLLMGLSVDLLAVGLADAEERLPTNQAG